MTDFSKKSQAADYFQAVMNNLQKSRIKTVFTLSAVSWNHNKCHRIYDTDTEVYVLFENDDCLVIDYRFIDGLDIQFRKLTEAEQIEYDRAKVKDFFNTVNDIYDYRENRIRRTETCEMEYGTIQNISLRSVTREYEKWIDNDIDFVSPTEETFDEISFTMNNGNGFVIMPCEASGDGYTLVWSEDTIETITEQ